jgi:CRP-like cAMP-binding protein
MLFADARCSGCVVRATLEGGLPSTGLEQVLQQSDSVTLRAKQVMYAQGAPAEALFMIRRGAVKLLSAEGDHQQPHLVRWMKGGHVLGLETVAGGTYRHTAVAIEALECCRIPLPVVDYLENAGRGFYRAVLYQAQAASDEADSFIATLSTGSAEQKLARLLLKLGSMHEGRYCVSLRRTDIGAALGTTMETASRMMAEFRRRGIVQAAGRRLHCDRCALQAIAGTPQVCSNG